MPRLVAGTRRGAPRGLRVSTFQVDPDSVRELARRLTVLGEQLDSAAEALARALLLVAASAGHGALEQAAADGATVWARGVGDRARAASALGSSTGAAADAYALVESAAGQRHRPGEEDSR